MPYKPELKVRELAEYNACYCGLCNVLQRKYGLITRFLLNYDCAFAAILISGVRGDLTVKSGRCGLKLGLKKKSVATISPSFEFCAALNVLLAYNKLRDDWRDEKKLLAALGIGAFYCSAMKAKKEYPELDKAIVTGMDAICKLERENCVQIDEPANAFGRMLGQMLSSADMGDDMSSQIMYEIGFHTGRWIYIIDAWVDRKKDLKRKNYNALNLSKMSGSRVKTVLDYSVTEAAKAYDLLTIKSSQGILDNTFFIGLYRVEDEKIKTDEIK